MYRTFGIFHAPVTCEARHRSFKFLRIHAEGVFDPVEARARSVNFSEAAAVMSRRGWVVHSARKSGDEKADEAGLGVSP